MEDRFNKIFKFSFGAMFLGIVINIAVLVFIGWVIVKILQYFGIV